MILLFVKSLAAHFRSGRTLFALTLFGVALGVASVLSIQIINFNALQAFTGSVKAISGEADFSVVGRMPTLPERLFPQVLADPDVEAAWPVYRIDVAVVGHDASFLEVVGVDVFGAPQLPWTDSLQDLAAPLRVPGWTAISPRLAARLGCDVGKNVRVSSGSREVDLHVGALVDFRRLSPLASSRLAVMDVAQVQHLFGRRGRLHQIDVRLAAGADGVAARSRLQQRLGQGVRMLTPEQRGREAAKLLGAFRLNLTALSLVSLVVGGFLVHASTEASLVRRRNEFGLLRSLGATRVQVVGLVLAEVAVLGLLGVLLGLPVGYAVAASNVGLVSATLSNIYLLTEIESLVLPHWLYPLAIFIGLGAAVGGAVLPTLDMSRRDTRALLVAYTLHERAAGRALQLCLGGVGVLVASVALYRLLAGWRPAGFVVGVALLVALPLMVPWTVRQATRGLPFSRFGLLYGAKALGLRLHTTSFAVAALAVAVSMMIGVTLMIGSFRRTLEIWVESTLQADVYVTTESWRRARDAATLDPALVDALSGHPAVAATGRLRQFFGQADQRRISVVGVDMGVAVERDAFALLDGRLRDAASALRQGAVIVSEPLARKARVQRGDRLTIWAEDREVSFPVAGVYYDYSSEAGAAAMDLATMERHFGPGRISNVALYLRGEADAAAVIGELRRTHAGLPLQIRSNGELRDEVFRLFDQTFAVTRLLQAMGLLIAACGIALALLVLARERIAELALYRALGAGRSQIFRVYLGKGLGIAVLGLLLGVVGGVGLAAVLVYLINRAYFGWTIAVHWPWSTLATQAAAILLVAALASVYPALRASRAPATELTRENL